MGDVFVRAGRNSIAVLGVSVLALGILNAGGAIADDSVQIEASDQVEATFTFEEVLGALENKKAARGIAAQAVTENGATASDFGLSVVEVGGVAAAVNHSLVRDRAGATSAATPEFVDLSWAPMEGVNEYVITVDGREIGITKNTSFRDKDVNAGETRSYQISASSFIDNTKDQGAAIHGITVDVPPGDLGNRVSAEEQVFESATAAAGYSNADLTWVTFIPEARIDAPAVAVPGVGCEYAAGYQFGGDNRGFAANQYASSAAGYRSYLNTNIAWTRASGIVAYDFYLGGTSVYEKSTGDRVETRYLSTSNARGEARLLGTDFYNTYADVRVELQAGNPFCVGNSIEGAFTATVTRTAYTISSGSHRQMPNHEIFMTGYGGGTPKIVYQRSYASPLCLVNLACPPAQLGGYTGGF